MSTIRRFVVMILIAGALSCCRPRPLEHEEDLITDLDRALAT